MRFTNLVLLSAYLTVLFVVPFAYGQEAPTVLKPNQLITYSLAPGQEKVFVLQMKKGEFADVQWLAREGLNLSFHIYDLANRDKQLLEDFYDGEESIWFVAPRDGDFILVSNLADQDPNISGAQRISIQYDNEFKLPVGTKQKDIRKINGYDVRIMSAPGTEGVEKGGNFVLIEKNGVLKKILNVSGGGAKGFSFPYPEYITRADRVNMRPGDIAIEERTISLIKSTADKTGDGISDVMIQFFSGGAHCCFAMYFINLGETVETVESLGMADSEGIGIDKNPSGGLLYRTADWNFAYWLTSFATSPAVSVVLEFKNGKLRPNFNLMKKPAPSLAVLRKKAQAQIQQLSLQPYRGKEIEDAETTNNLYKKDASYSEGVFWAEMLDLVYTGNEDLAWQLLDLVWPPQKRGKELFIRDFKKQLLESQYWKMILEDNRDLILNPDPKYQQQLGGVGQLLATGYQQLRQGKYDEAIATAGNVLSSEPMNAEAWLLRGNGLTHRGKIDEAIKSLKTSIFWDQQLIEAHIRLGTIFAEKGDCLQAKNYAATAIQIDTNNKDAIALRRLSERCITAPQPMATPIP